MTNKVTGTYGEDIAVSYLLKKSYELLTRNYRMKFGEIDIIVRDKEFLVFVEVKTRNSNKYGRPIESIDNKKINTIRKVAETYINKNKYYSIQPRFDIIEIMISNNKDIKLNHIVNAF